MSEQKKKKYTNLGVMMKAKKKNEADPNEAPRFYIKLEQQTKKDGTPYGESIFPITLANGKKLNSGDVISMFSKKEKFKQAVKEDRMSQEDADRLSSFLLFDLVLTENVDNGEKDSDDINF